MQFPQQQQQQQQHHHQQRAWQQRACPHHTRHRLPRATVIGTSSNNSSNEGRQLQQRLRRGSQLLQLAPTHISVVAAAAAATGPAASASAAERLVERTCEHDWRTPLPGHDHPDPAQRPVLALGKFDALHSGHYALAAAAARQLGGSPVLLSFSGMAGVLGWAPRKPLVAPCDRPRVLHLWAQQLAAEQQQQQQQQQHGSTSQADAAAEAHGGVQQPQQTQRSPVAAPVRQRYVPFAAVRSLSPQAFVDHISGDLRAAGVVAGSNYRFGYKAAGDAALLQQLCAAAGLPSKVVELVVGTAGPVSSSKIREMLGSCDMHAVAAALGRPYRLVAEVGLQVAAQQAAVAGGSGSATPNSSTNGAASQPQPWPGQCVFVPFGSCLNQHPAPGAYQCLVQVFVGASARTDLLQLQEAVAALDGQQQGACSTAGGVQVLQLPNASWCVRLRACEVQVLADGLLLPQEVWEAVQACANNSAAAPGRAGDGCSTSAAGRASQPLAADQTPVPLLSCWDLDDIDEAMSGSCAVGGAVVSSSSVEAEEAATSALLVLDFDA